MPSHRRRETYVFRSRCHCLKVSEIVAHVCSQTFMSFSFKMRGDPMAGSMKNDESFEGLCLYRALRREKRGKPYECQTSVNSK